MTPNDWTVMFFFASDNPLAPLLVSQLKAIKDAGFQEHTEVLVYFDPMEKGVPTKIYNVNQQRKAAAKEKTKIGDGKDSFIRKMAGDEVGSEEFSPAMQTAMNNPSMSAHEALAHFVDYGINKHRARNYMLFLVGHGMIVGRDMFLPDEDPVSAITLKQLQEIMQRFVENGKTSLQLLGLHSCCMSSVEVAYQLRGTANYMIAHQGPAFVNSWPYRQLLKKILNTIDKKKRDAEQVDIKTLVEKLYYHCLFNATDFLSAGYSADLALCSLEEDKLEGIKEPLQRLVKKLKANLGKQHIVKDQILLAHWESQSFWEENYTDLYDFCRCLSKGCNDRASSLETLNSTENGMVQELRDVRDACDALIEVLDIREWKKRFDGLVIHEDNFGTKYPYARGLSVYFPWCEPLDDEPVPIEPKAVQPRPGQPEPERRSQKFTKYMDYDFNTKFGDDSWWSFLDLYFEQTKRDSDKEANRDRFDKMPLDRIDVAGVKSLLTTAERSFNSDGSLGSRTPEVGSRTPETGVPCTCPTIKNYPTENYPTELDKKFVRKIKKFAATPGALWGFRKEVDLYEEDSSNDDDDELG